MLTNDQAYLSERKRERERERDREREINSKGKKRKLSKKPIEGISGI